MAGMANQSFVVVFVEGETDFQFFTKLLKYYEQNSSSSIRFHNLSFASDLCSQMSCDECPSDGGLNSLGIVPMGKRLDS